jgi:hypothetical protein
VSSVPQSFDIVPTRHVAATAGLAFGMTYEHWFFLAQPPGFPERLIGQDPEFYLRTKLASWAGAGHRFLAEAIDQYVRYFRDPAVIVASCEDYRAAVGIDLGHDEGSYSAGERVRCPLLVLWESAGFTGRHYDVASIWNAYATDVFPLSSTLATSSLRRHRLPQWPPCPGSRARQRSAALASLGARAADPARSGAGRRRPRSRPR